VRILGVDDEVKNAELPALALRDGGHEAEFVNGGEAALGRMAGMPFEAVVTDLRMPRMDGLELLRELILQALERAGGNKSQAARLLGLTRRTPHSRMEKHHLRKPGEGVEAGDEDGAAPRGAGAAEPGSEGGAG
jgi:DNA-binding NtrC family response regulator